MPPACEHMQEKLEAYVDHELGGAEGDRIAMHLEQCPACAEAAAALQQVKRVLRTQTRRIPVPVHMRARIRRSLAGGAGFGEAIRRVLVFYPRQAAAALAGAAAAVIAATMLSARWWTSFADPIAYQSDALISGRIICVDCALMQKTRTEIPHAPSHHLVIQTREGKIWTIVLSPTGQELLQKTNIASHLVQARGYAFPRVGYVQVTDFEISQN
ncbi:MAG: zf-HC2 domain-containing protein [bacterium]